MNPQTTGIKFDISEKKIKSVRHKLKTERREFKDDRKLKLEHSMKSFRISFWGKQEKYLFTVIDLQTSSKIV